MEKEKKVKDVDFADSAVPSSARKNVVTMFMIMLGFTFFSASMWVGQQLADGLDFWGFLGSLILVESFLVFIPVCSATSVQKPVCHLIFCPREPLAKKVPICRQP